MAARRECATIRATGTIYVPAQRLSLRAGLHDEAYLQGWIDDSFRHPRTAGTPGVARCNANHSVEGVGPGHARDEVSHFPHYKAQSYTNNGNW